MNCNINTSVRNKTLRFFKQGTEWYADVPNHTLAQNRMVAGADTLLESMAHGGREVCVCMSADVEDPDAYRIKMKRIEHDPWGATYRVTDGNVGAAPSFRGPLGLPVAWLCNQTHRFIGGEHPSDIYVHSITAA